MKTRDILLRAACLLSFLTASSVKSKVPAILSFIACLLLPSCALNPAWLFDTGMDYDKKRGRMLDTPRNRQELTTSYLSFIRREASGEDPPPWESVWRGIFNALDAGNDNPGFYKNFIIEERRRHGLPKLGFL